MANAYDEYHPYRFATLSQRLTRRAQIVSKKLNVDRAIEYSAMDDAEFSRRLENYNQIGWFRQKWVDAGMQILDVSRSPRASDHMRESFELPALAEGDAVFIHFGAEPFGSGDVILEQAHIDGVYVAGVEIAGEIACMFAVVCSPVNVDGLVTVGDLLKEQSQVAIGFLKSGVPLDEGVLTAGEIAVFEQALAQGAITGATNAIGPGAENIGRCEAGMSALLPNGPKPH